MSEGDKIPEVNCDAGGQAEAAAAPAGAGYRYHGPVACGRGAPHSIMCLVRFRRLMCRIGGE